MPAGAARNAVRAELCIQTAVADAKASLPIAAQGLAESRAIGDRVGESRFLHCEGYARESLGDSGQAASRYAAAVEAGEAGGNREVLADALTARGELRHFNGEYGDAIADLKRAHELNLAGGPERSQRYVLNAMANLYADPNVGEYDRAIGYYRELLAGHEKAGRRGEAATAQFNLGATYESKREYAQALAQYRKALRMSAELGDAESVAETRRVIGATLVKQGSPAQALAWIDQSLDWYRKANDADSVNRVRLTRGIALRAAGEPVRALAELDAAGRHFAAEHNQRFLLRIDEERALAHADLGQWQQAYAALRRQFDIQRELDRTLAEERSARLRVQFDSERTEQLNRTLRSENASSGAALQAAEREQSLQRQVIVLGALLLGLLAALVLRQLLKSRRLRLLAMTDELTGLPNRRNILAFLDGQLRIARRSGALLSVVAFDIDHFKRINDSHGHDAGDRALKQLSMLVAAVLRSSDRLGRVGGEEFLMVLPGTGADAALEIAERARQAVEVAGFDDVAPGLRLAISLGVASCASGRDDKETLVKHADLALYRAKQGGRNRVEAGSPAIGDPDFRHTHGRAVTGTVN
jgi:diguanylate cyclase (GGDEF)-like protein